MESFDAGSLRVAASVRGGVLAGLDVALRRPPVAGLLAGRSPAQAVAIVPRLFSLCSRAQQAAAAAALAAATDAGLPPGASRELWTECLHEHLWRLLLDWPLALGFAQEATLFAAWRRARGGEDIVPASEATVAAALAGVIARSRERLGAGDAPPPAAEQIRPGSWLAAFVAGADFPVAPAGPATVAAAYAQRVGALLEALAGLRAGRPFPVAAVGEAGYGVGQALTARGVLTHAARVVDGRIVDYRIWAPTDRRFATPAELRRLVSGLRWPDAASARRGLELALLALDPCLPYALEVADA